MRFAGFKEGKSRKRWCNSAWIVNGEMSSGFEYRTFRNMKGESSLTYWNITKYPPQGGDRQARLTIDDPEPNDVRVVLPAATLVRFDKNLHLYNTDGTARQFCWVAQADRCYISRRVAQLVEHHERLLDISARRSQVRVLPRQQFYIPNSFKF